MAMLEHPHILHVLDAGTHNGFPYLITEYCPRGSLHDRIKRQALRPFPTEEALSILTQIGEALQFAHEQNIVHRDLKPENILFNTKGQTLLADFGIAKMLDTIGVRQGTIIGTPSYMAPEQFRGLASRESDQYSLGCIAYELFTGRQPFIGPDMPSLMFKHFTEQPVAPRQVNGKLPEHIEQAVLKALAKEREGRYAHIASFIGALRKSAEQQPSIEQWKPALQQEAVEQLKTAKYWLDEGNALMDARQYQEALDAYEQTIHLDPNHADAYKDKGRALNELKRYKEALAVYEQVIRLEPKNASAYIYKGHTLYRSHRYREALDAYEQAILLNPYYAEAYKGKGDAHHKRHFYSKARFKKGRFCLTMFA